MKKNQQERALLQQVITAIQSFNAMELLHLLDQERTYQDVSLYEFMEIVSDKLRSFKNSGDTVLKLSYELCNGCQCNTPVAVFTGNHTGNSYALLFEFEDQDITDIYECTWYGDMNFIDTF